MDRKWLKLFSVSLVSGVLLTGTQTAWAGVTLFAVKTAVAPKLDGIADPLWSKGKAVNIPVLGGKNLPGGKTSVSLKALYTTDRVYFLAQYKDPTQSLMRHPWQKQANGAWKKLSTSDADDENKYYEDRLALLWNINTPAFASKGCDAACHLGQGKAYGNMYTPAAGQKLDLWHIKTVRTVPVGQGDDQYIDGVRFDSAKSPDAGRHSDPKIGGGYSDNQNAGKTMPMYALLGNKVAPPYWLLDSKKVAFDNSKYKAGDKVPSIIVAPIKGDRGDLAAKIRWNAGAWTYEFSRKRVTGSANDVQFNNLAKVYPFGVAVFDNAEVRHARDLGVQLLKFK